MNSVDEALEKQLQNIQTRTGKTLDELYAHIRKSRLVKHGEIRTLLKKDPGMGHGDANTLATFFLKSDGQGADHPKESSTDDMVNAIYAGPKAVLRPTHDKLMSAIDEFGSAGIRAPDLRCNPVAGAASRACNSQTRWLSNNTRR